MEIHYTSTPIFPSVQSFIRGKKGKEEGEKDPAAVTVLTVGELGWRELFVPLSQLFSKFVVV